jgi:hypothetical protein
MFSFDLEKIAEALKRGVGQEELQNIIEAEMASSLENMMAESSQVSLSDPSPLMAGDLSGRMTPPLGESSQHDATAAALAGRMTPPTTSGNEQGTPSAAELANRLGAVSAKHRRSSMLQNRRISMALQCACAEHEDSLAKAMVKELGATTECDRQEVAQVMRQCVMNSRRQHRQSLMKAVDVLEAAGLGEEFDQESPNDEHSSSQVKSQLQFVQQAVDVARRRHRQSIVQAVHNRTGQHAGKLHGVSDSPMSGLSRERVQQIIDAAYAREQSEARGSRRKGPVQQGTLLALMSTRTSQKGLAVHCGPPQRPVKRASQKQRPHHGGS